LPPLVLTAVLLFAAGLALGVLTGWSVPLGAALFRYDPALLNTAQAGIQRYVSPDLWDLAVLPLLERPSWVMPASLGVVLLLAQAALLVLRGRRRGASV
jgi:hypothetical protein